MNRFLLLPASLVLVLGLSACGDRQFRPLGFLNRAPDPVVSPPEEVATDADGEEIVDADGAGDTPTPSASGELGTTIASLGDPTVPGLWLETGLVSTETPGRVIAENGQSVELTLRPSGGEASAGSRLSVAAMQALGLGLTDLAPLTVFAGP